MHSTKNMIILGIIAFLLGAAVVWLGQRDYDSVQETIQEGIEETGEAIEEAGETVEEAAQ